MKGYNAVATRSGLIRKNETQEDEALMHQLRKVKTMGDQGFVTKGVMYSERKDGVLPEFDIRTDKWVVAEQASSRASKAEINLRGGSMPQSPEAPEGAKGAGNDGAA